MPGDRRTAKAQQWSNLEVLDPSDISERQSGAMHGGLELGHT